MIPSQVQHAKEGKWYNWTAGAVDAQMLAMRVDQTAKDAYVNGVVVHALKFPNDRSWSVTGGWKK